MDYKRIENIRMEYADDVNASRDREQAMINTVNMWLSPLIERFNREKAVVVLFFKAEPENHVYFESISKDLELDANTQLKQFLPYR
jgi:hypothetical protein